MAVISKPNGLNTPFKSAAWIALSSALKEIDDNWSGALSGKNPDALHDLRVGTRRLRAALSIYEAVLPPRELRRAERAVAQLTDILGPARDADVLIDHLASVADTYAKENDEEASGVRSLLEFTRKGRGDKQKSLEKALRSFDIDQLKSDIGSADPGKREKA